MVIAVRHSKRPPTGTSRSTGRSTGKVSPEVASSRTKRSSRAPAAPQIDTSRTRVSDAGLYKATITPDADPAPINEMHTWTLHVETPDGKPVENAQVSVDGGMPEHGHGLPTQPKVTKYLGNGDYLVEGMRFNMPGMWQLKFRVTAGGQMDQVVFNLALRG